MPRLFGSLLTIALLLIAAWGPAQEPKLPLTLLEQSPRIVFLGDSITAAGQYVAFFDTWLLTRRLAKHPTVIDAGLASETVSGLSEEGHAGGKFPRPDLAERLDRVLDLTKPNLVIACYGMNCGIYQPFAEERLARYQAGYVRLKQAVEQRGAQLIVVTPPSFDDAVRPGKFSYNEVLNRYSEWLVSQRAAAWRVIDLHTPMTAHLEHVRRSQPKFTLQPDAVHPNEAGHWYIAQQLASAFGDEQVPSFTTPAAMLEQRGLPSAILPLVQQRVNVLRDAYVHTAGHKRPGVARGLPLAEAEAKAAELTVQIGKLLPAP
jgi:lysophospholipase L1-like esterase